nr:polysaccharide deacetylase family protein [uncultured Fluviicola sp.]
MLFYVDEISVRLIYTLDFVFNEHGLDYQLTNDKHVFESFEGTKISYSNLEFEDELILNPASLLFEETFRESVQVEKGSWEGVDCLQFDSVPDPLASIFYVLTRYEEYLVKFPDEHGRFTAKESILSKFGWLHIQIVEHWIEAFFRIYSQDNLKKLESGRSVRIIPSFDIDNTFAFKWKEGWRSWLSNGKDLMKNNKERMQTRKSVQKGELKDPYDSFELIGSIYKKYPETRVFWHLGNYAKYDTNIAWNDPRHQKLILEMSSIGYLGLHPSYSSNYSDEKLNQEVVRIKTITSKPVIESRQHFLKLNLPKTYRRMMERGFEKDYTMGYADDYGFRAGTAHEHAFFDLLTNEAFPNYRIVPFAYMDGTLLEYKKLSIEKSLEVINQLVGEVKRYGGVFCFIWHNETIAEAGKWKGWKKVFDHTLTQLK